jgi:hypothetical protein
MKLVETLELLSKAREYVAQRQEELIEQREIVDQLERLGATRWKPYSFWKISKICRTCTLLTWTVLRGKS